MPTIVPPLLQPRSSDEYTAAALLASRPARPGGARPTGSSGGTRGRARRTGLRLRPARHGGDAAGDRRRPRRRLLRRSRPRPRPTWPRPTPRSDGDLPVIDVQTHLIDPSRWGGAGSQALSGFLQLVDAERWADPVDPTAIDGAAWASLVFGSSETAIALLTSTPGTPDRNVLSNPQIAAARDLVDRYAGTGRVLTHTIVHPNLGPAGARQRWSGWHDALSPVGLEVLHAVGAADEGGARRRVVPRRRGDRLPVPRAGPRPRAARGRHPQGRQRPDPRRDASRPRRRATSAPPSVAFPDISFVVYHSGYERDPDGAGGRLPRRRRGRAASTAWCAAWPTPAWPRGRTSTPSSAPRGSSSCAGPRRPPTSSASCCWPSGPTTSCGAPTASGTDRRST